MATRVRARDFIIRFRTGVEKLFEVTGETGLLLGLNDGGDEWSVEGTDNEFTKGVVQLLNQFFLEYHAPTWYFSLPHQELQ